jgi:hypothetical protein
VVFGIVLGIFGIACVWIFRGYKDVRHAHATYEVETNEATALLPTSTDLKEEGSPGSSTPSVNVGVGDLLKTPAVLVVGMCMVLAPIGIGLADVGLALHLDNLNGATNDTLLSDVGKNALFFVTPITYGVMMFFILGHCVDAFVRKSLSYLHNSMYVCTCRGDEPDALEFFTSFVHACYAS